MGVEWLSYPWKKYMRIFYLLEVLLSERFSNANITNLIDEYVLGHQEWAI